MHTVCSATVLGLHTQLVRVEISTTQGFPQLTIVGLASKSITEAKERITTALLGLGFTLPKQKTVINLAPASIQKHGGTLDLALAAAILLLSKKIPQHSSKTLYIGEVSLDGTVRPVKGALPIVQKAFKTGFTRFVVPHTNMNELSLLKDVALYPIRNIQELTSEIPQITQQSIPSPKRQLEPFTQSYFPPNEILLATLTAAGDHGLHLTGPPGSGKSLLAQSIPTLLPKLEYSEQITATTIHSVAQQTPLKQPIYYPPIRTPHHTTTSISLIGGGSKLLPGEVSLAHHGVLLLDEAPEFSRQSLEALRQPLEDGYVTISRNSGTTRYPAQFQLILTSNPCPCGYWGSLHTPCICSPRQRAQYRQKLSGPLRNRVALHYTVYEDDFTLLAPPEQKVSQQLLTQKVIRARQRQKHRYKTSSNKTNATVPFSVLKQHLSLQPKSQHHISDTAKKNHWSHRTLIHFLRIVRTLADTHDSETITQQHVSQLLPFFDHSDMLH